MAQSLLHADLKRVVRRDSLCFPEVRVRVVADEWHAEGGVAIRAREFGDGSPHLFGLKNAEASVGVGGLISVGVNLSINGVGRSGDARLIEWNREKLVHAAVACITDV